MLENIRKYTGLFIVVLVIVFVGLIFIESNSGGRGPGSGPVVVKTDLKSYSQKDLQAVEQEIRLGQRILQTSTQSGSFDAYGDISQFLGTLGAGGLDNSLENYLVHRTNFERAKKEFGLFPSQDDIDLYQREHIFTNREGIFDDESYKTFKNEILKGLGVTLNDLNAFIGDIIAFKEFANILGAGVIGNEKAAQNTFVSQQQQVTLSTLALDLETFRKDISPTEEETKLYWEENQGRYLTEPKRKLTYFVAKPDFEAALAEKKQTESEREKTPAEEAAEAEKSAEEIADTEEAEISLTPAERKKVIDELGLTIEENIWVVIQQQIENGAEEAELEALASEFGYEVKTTEMLPLSELPTEIRGSVRGTRTTVEQELNSVDLATGNVMDTLSEILGIGAENWLLYRVDDALNPVVKTFEEAQEDAKNDLIQKLAEEALTEAIQAARDAVASALEDGKTLAEAAAEHNLKLTEQLAMSGNGPVPGEPNSRDIFRLASQTKSGELSKAELIAPFNNRGLFVFVKEREFVETDQNQAGLDRVVSTQQQVMRGALVQHWFTAEFDKLNVEIVNPQS